MKNAVRVLVLSMLALTFVFCSKPEVKKVLIIKDKTIVHPVKEPGKGGTITLDAWTEIDWLGDKVSDNSGRRYYHIRIMDGAEGVVDSAAVIENGKAGVVIKDAALRSGEGLSIETDNVIPVLTFVAVTADSAGFMRVVSPELSISGWVLRESVSGFDNDIRAARIAADHKLKNDNKLNLSVLNEMETTGDCGQSEVYDIVKELIAKAAETAAKDSAEAAASEVEQTQEGSDMTAEDDK